MPKKARELTATHIKNLDKPGRHAVGTVPGLLLVIKDTGAKSWMLRTVIGTKRRNIGLGGYPEVSLAQAREKAREHKEAIRQGVDPLEKKKAAKAKLRALSGRMTFSDAARACHDKKSSEFRSDKHAQDWLASVNRYAIPVIGRMPVDEIDIHHMLKILQPIWNTKTETASRLRQRMEEILAWATVSKHRKGDNPARWRGHLDAVLSPPNRIKKKKHFPALPWREIGSFMAALKKSKGMSARALEFIILTACRSGEARFATWDEIEGRVWTIPANRTKTGKEHKVPLCDDVMALLDALPRFVGSNYLFPSARAGVPMSDMTISKKIKDMHKANIKAGGKGYLDPKQDRIVVPHGFRSAFRDWAAESTNFPREVAEMALGHTIDSQVEAAYRRGNLLAKRIKLMEAWAGFCRKPLCSGEVVQIQDIKIRG